MTTDIAFAGVVRRQHQIKGIEFAIQVVQKLAAANNVLAGVKRVVDA